MDRRQALLAAIALVGGAVVDGAVPTWAYSGTPVAPGAPGRFFDAREMGMLAAVAAIMIPATATPGAQAVNVPGVVDGLMLDWASAATRAQLRQVLADIDAKVAPRGFLAHPPTEQAALLFGLDVAAFKDKSRTGEGFRRLKQLIWYAYFTSEGADPDYVPVPGQYRGDLSRAELDQLLAEAR